MRRYDSNTHMFRTVPLNGVDRGRAMLGDDPLEPTLVYESTHEGPVTRVNIVLHNTGECACDVTLRHLYPEDEVVVGPEGPLVSQFFRRRLEAGETVYVAFDKLLRQSDKIVGYAQEDETVTAHIDYWFQD